MKCPQCSYNQRVKFGMKCGGCGYAFTFNPKDVTVPGMTDGKFAGHIRAASRGGTTYFTENQLYGAYCRRAKRAPGYFVAIAVFMVIAGIVASANGAAWIGPALWLGAVVVVAMPFIAKPKVMPRREFWDLVRRWQEGGKGIEHLLDAATLHKPPPKWTEPDLYDYGVGRLLVVERKLLVDLFVYNNQHAELQMLVISESGYPEYLLPQVRRLLEESPELPIFLLHDATPRGTQMAERVQQSTVLPLAQRHVTDLGLFPEDFRRLKRTSRYDPENKQRALPADAIPLAVLTTGLAASFDNGFSLGEQLHRDAQNQADSGSSFG